MLWGGDGNDTLVGLDASSDTLRGEAGDDRIYANNDNAVGGAGDDTLYALGADAWLTGGTELDRFHIQYNEGDAHTAVITDFSTADRLFVEYQDREDGFRFNYYGDTFFQLFDTNGDRFLDANDGFSVTPEGVGLGVEARRRRPRPRHGREHRPAPERRPHRQHRLGLETSPRPIKAASTAGRTGPRHAVERARARLYLSVAGCGANGEAGSGTGARCPLG